MNHVVGICRYGAVMEVLESVIVWFLLIPQPWLVRNWVRHRIRGGVLVSYFVVAPYLLCM